MNGEVFSIRKAQAADLDRIGEIEIDAYPVWAAACDVKGEPFSTPRATTERWLETGLLVVAVGADDRAIGFVAAAEKGGGLYIAEIDVESAWQGRGVGRQLMLSILDEGRRRRWPFATLTTDRFAPFNAPFYARLGFAVIDEEDLSDFLRMKLKREAEHGLDPARRIAMRFDFE